MRKKSVFFLSKNKLKKDFVVNSFFVLFHFKTVSESLSKEKKKGYDSDEDEANTLVIEEEDELMQPEEPTSDDAAGIHKMNSTLSVSIDSKHSETYLLIALKWC